MGNYRVLPEYRSVDMDEFCLKTVLLDIYTHVGYKIFGLGADFFPCTYFFPLICDKLKIGKANHKVSCLQNI